MKEKAGLTGRGKRMERAIMAVPVSLWMVLFVAVPIGYIFIMSFLEQGDFSAVKLAFTLDNYREMANPLNLAVFGKSIVIATVTTVLCLLIAYPFAFFVAQKSTITKTVCMAFVMIPFMVSSLIRLFSWITILRRDGILNTVLMDIGLIHAPVQLCYNMIGAVIGLVYTLLPFMILPLYSSIEKLDPSLLEAASDLGAQLLQRFVKVILPLTFPGIFAGIIMVFIPTLGLFFVTDVMGGQKVQVIGNLIQNQFVTARNWPAGAALSIVLILLTFLFIGIYKGCGGSMDDLGGV